LEFLSLSHLLCFILPLTILGVMYQKRFFIVE